MVNRAVMLGNMGLGLRLGCMRVVLGYMEQVLGNMSLMLLLGNKMLVLVMGFNMTLVLLGNMIAEGIGVLSLPA